MVVKMSKPTIAVIGVSSNKMKYGYKVFKDLMNKGYKVYGVNPKYDSIERIKIYSSIDELPTKPDIVVFVVKPPVAYKILSEHITLESFFWFQPGSESKESIDLCISQKIKCIFNACIMRETDKGELKIKDGKLLLEDKKP